MFAFFAQHAGRHTGAPTRPEVELAAKESSTMRNFLKVVTGAVLVINCSVNVIVVGMTPSLHDEPVAMYVANLSVADLSFGLFLALIGLSDMVLQPDVVPLPLCVSLQYAVLSSAFALKLAQVVVALDLLVAVVKPLHYHQIMSDWMKPLLALPWLGMLLDLLIGALCSALQLESSYDFGLRQGWLTEVGTDCRWEKAPSVWAFIIEGQLFTLSAITGGVFIYASVIGIRQQRAIEERGEETSANRAFFVRRFKSFRKIAKVLLLFITLDIIGAGTRISARWFYLPLLSSAIHFLRMLFIAVETWVYGMNNVSLRDAYTTFLQEHLGFFKRAPRVQPEIIRPAARVTIAELPSLDGSSPRY